MRILFLSDDFPPQSFGGAGISTYDLALGMKETGHDVSVITTCRRQDEAGESEYQGLKIFKIASDYPARWRAYLSLYNKPVVKKVEDLLKRIRPDVVHANNIHFYLSYHSLKIAKQYAKVVVITFRDTMSFYYGKLQTKQYLENFDCRTSWLDHLKQAKERWNPFRNFLIRRYLRYVDKLFAVSSALKKALEQNGIGNVEVMHTGALVDWWHVNEKEAAQFRRRYNIENKKVIFFGGRLSEAKGASVALKTMEKISRELPNTVLLVAGTGYLRERDDVKFTGWIEREEIKVAYAVADVVLVPSLYFDSFPRIVIEAMASGRPVVGTCYGGASEVIEDSVTGYVVNPFDVSLMSEKLIDILSDPIKAERFGSAGRQRVKEEFSLEKLTNRYLDRYAKIL